MKSTDTIGEALRAMQEHLEGDDDPAMAELCGLVNQAAEEHATVAAITDAENAAAIVAAAEAPIGAPAHDDERETWITGIVEAAFAVDYETPPGGMSDAKTRLSAWIEQGIERGYIDADRGAYMRADLPVIQSTATDAAIDAAVAQAEPPLTCDLRAPSPKAILDDAPPQPNRFAVQEAPAWVQAFVEAFGATITEAPVNRYGFVPVVRAVITRGNVEAAHEVLRRHVGGHYEIRVERAEQPAGGES